MTHCVICHIEIAQRGFLSPWRSVAVVPYPGYNAWCYGKAAGTLHHPTKEGTNS